MSRSSPAPVAALSAVLTAVICWPLFGGYLLHRDAVATPRSPLTAAAFGIDGAPPRAIPQDGLLALASQVVDGGFLVATITALALFGAGVGYGRLAGRLLPGAGTAGMLAAAVAGIWNPFVAERLLQGHWSLLTGYAALGWIVCAVLDVRDRPGWRSWAVLAGAFAVAGFTPTGSVFALIVGAVCVLSARPTLPRAATVAGVWTATALPWLVSAGFSESPAGPVGGAEAFAARAETGLGTVGSVLGLGGIWNAEAVPASRAGWWAAVATGCFLVLLIVGSVLLLRTRRALPAAVPALAALALAVVLLMTLAATGPGLDLTGALLTHVPGAGLLRDTQKYLALAVPFVVLAVAAVAGRLRTWVPTGFAVAAIALLLIAPLPDLAWGVGGKLRPVDYPPDYARVTALIGHDDRAVAVWPASPMRDYPWNHGPSLSPLPRMLDAPVVLDEELAVDGEAIDRSPQRVREVIDVLEAGGGPAELARLGVGWVVIERDAAGNVAVPAALDRLADDSRSMARVYDGRDLTVYRIDAARAYPSPGTGAWIAAGIAHGVWVLCLLAGLAAAVVRLSARRSRY